MTREFPEQRHNACSFCGDVYPREQMKVTKRSGHFPEYICPRCQEKHKNSTLNFDNRIIK